MQSSQSGSKLSTDNRAGLAPALSQPVTRTLFPSRSDPGDGFDPAQLEHAAVNNPSDDPLRHVATREEKGLRAGGFGILMTRQLVDELVYNERHNELMFVKFLP